MNPRYEIQGQLGEGGEASVWKAWDTRLQRYVAIKRLLPPSQREVPDAGDIFAEASTLSALQHPNIVSVYDVEVDKDIGPYVVMEFLNGENLEQTILRGALTKNDFISITCQVLEGLVAAHKMGVQHRDIKPSNIMLTWLPDQRFMAKVLDFGLAKFTTRPLQQTVKTGNKILGSIFFMAPEQFSHRPLDYRSDLYSLGCVLYYALTTRYPFAGDTPSQVIQSHLDHMVSPLRDVRPDIQPLLCDWVMWLLRRQPEHRPREASQALEIFRGLVDGSITEIPQAVTGLRTTTVMPTRKVPVPGGGSKSGPKASVNTAAMPAGSKKWLYAALAAAPILAAAAFFLTKTPGAAEPSSSGPPALPNGLQPPQTGLLLWMDPSRGVFKDAGESPSAVGESVAFWADQSPFGGTNVFQYIKTTRADLEKCWPLLVEIKNEGGIKGALRCLKFDGEDNLVLRDRDDVGDPVGNALDGKDFSYLIVFRPGDPGKSPADYLLSSEKDKDKEPHEWGSFIRGGGMYSGDSKHPAGPNFVTAKGGFRILTAAFDAKNGSARQWLTAPDGKSVGSMGACTIDPGPIRLLRLGAIAHTKVPEGPQNGYFHGEVAEILLYNKLLSDTDLHAARTYLCQRYFGCDAAPVAAPLPNFPPAQSALAIWLDASKGALDKEGKELNTLGRHVWGWRDQAPGLGGANDFFAPELGIEAHDFAAKLEECQDESGLRGRHRVLRFGGHDSLALSPDGPSLNPLAAGTLDKNTLTVCAMVRISGSGDYNRIISAKMGEEAKAWDLGVHQGKIQAGVRLPDGKSNKSEIKFNGRDLFVALCFVWDGPAGKAQVWVQKPDGTLETGQQIPANFDHGPLRQIRVGSAADFDNSKDADFLTGDVAEVLIYNRPLSDTDRIAALSYLARRYFDG